MQRPPGRSEEENERTILPIARQRAVSARARGASARPAPQRPGADARARDGRHRSGGLGQRLVAHEGELANPRLKDLAK